MTKTELSEILHGLNIQVDEGISSEKSGYPRIVYWPYAEKDIVASGEEYKNRVTYQISLYAKVPQCEKYKELRGVLREKGIHPEYYHEYVEKDPIYSNTWHTYFALEVIEDV